MLTALLSASTFAQDVDREKYPDYDPTFCNPEPALIKMRSLIQEKRELIKKQEVQFGGRRTGKERTALELAQEELGLPDHWDNSDFKHFPPVFNQSGGSCGSASRIGYMFTHEMNSFRDADGSKLENRYPTHFVWLLTNGGSGKDAFVEYVGVPSARTYGGITTSSLFGTQDTSDDCFGWMTGYEKWYEGFFNRMYTPTSNPYTLGTDEGKLGTKAWLYNHAGDTDFHSGGIIGLGVASGGWWYDIPKTTKNDEIGVTGKKYVGAWGTQVDHAITLVGWDDRIEFDLDGDGIKGEKGEVGAWIIVNSWGGWCNNGFIYCPYAYAGPTFKEQGSTRVFSGGFWQGELYKVRKNYRPYRTIKLKMQYSRRSEMLLQCGVSSNLNATKPSKTIDLHHFRYAGDGNGGNTNPAPEVPMLGKWADGIYHTEPMEFGYDLTDLTASFDREKPLKYFFIVNTKSWAAGEGSILGASIIDYEKDLEGIETPFDLGDSSKVEIKNAGKQTIISVIVYGNSYNKPNAVSCYNGVLSWAAPDHSSHTVQSYNVYSNGVLLTNTKETTYNYDPISKAVTFNVSAIYEDGTESASVGASTGVVAQNPNTVLKCEQSGFTIPGVFTDHYDACTIEFCINPTIFRDYNCEVGPGWGTWMQHFGSDGTYSCGWSQNSRINSSTKFTKGTWQHVAIVINKGAITLYRNGAKVGNTTSDSHSGLGGFGDLVFSSSPSQNWSQEAMYDEIRIWNKARTQSEIKGGYAAIKRIEYFGNTMPDGLLAYYKGDTFKGTDGNTYLRDCVGGHHAMLHTSDAGEVVDTTLIFTQNKIAASLKMNKPSTENIYVGTPVNFSATYSDGINEIYWTIPGVGMTEKHVVTPNVTFTAEGEQSVIVFGKDYAGNIYSDTLVVTVGTDTTPIDATFKTTTNSVNAGDRISFIPNSYQSNYAYHWELEGADEEDLQNVSVATRYSISGVFDAKLTVTAPDGRSASSTQKITVKAVAPQASFEIDKKTIALGEPITFTSTSKYEPTHYEWIIANSQLTTVVTDAQPTYTFEPKTGGYYDVTLKVSNEIGINSTKVQKAFIVANADSKTGLTFAKNGNQMVVFDHQPIPASTTACDYSIDMWLNPASFKPVVGVDTCRILGIGDDASTFLLTTNEKGAMTVYIDGKQGTSPEGYVIEGAWHNYMIAHSTTGRVTFYRDNQQIGYVASMPTGMPTCKTFKLGADNAQMNGTIDELRFWQYNMQIAPQKKVINQPLENPDEYVSGTYKLLAYYDFNHNSGNVLDRTSGKNDGVRMNFGPEGDAWTISAGVFTLDFSTSATKDVSTSMKNYKRSFTYYTTSVNTSVANRFYKIKEWTLENTNTFAGATAGAHVDKNKYYDFTVTTGYDKFPDLTNHKAYQTIELEPGFYTFSCTFGMHEAAGDSYLVVADGTGLPDDVNDAISYCPLADAECTFLVKEKKSVSLGVFVKSMTGQNIFCIQKFKLTKAPIEIVTGIDVLDEESNDDNTLTPYMQGIFDMQGRKIEAIKQPGLYIVNGKKILKK